MASVWWCGQGHQHRVEVSGGGVGNVEQDRGAKEQARRNTPRAIRKWFSTGARMHPSACKRQRMQKGRADVSVSCNQSSATSRPRAVLHCSTL